MVFDSDCCIQLDGEQVETGHKRQRQQHCWVTLAVRSLASKEALVDDLMTSYL